MLDPIKNFAIATLSTGYNAAATSIALSSGDGAKFPDPATDGAFNVTWWNSTDYSSPDQDPNVEIVRVTAKSGDTLTVTRAQENTTASVKNGAGATYLIGLTLTEKTMSDVEQLASLKPFGAYAFYQGVANYGDRPEMPQNYQIKGNFTVLKKFKTGTSGYNANFIKVNNDAGDEIIIGNSGYSFKIEIKKAGTSIHSFSESSSVNFTGTNKYDLFVEVDYDLNEVRLSYSGYSNTYSVPNLYQLKDTVFTYSKAETNSYNGNIKGWWLFAGLYNHGSLSMIFAGTGENDFPAGNVNNHSAFKEIVATAPTIMNAFGQQKTFVAGKVNFSSSTPLPRNYSYHKNYTFNYDLAYENRGANLIVKMSMDINVGSIKFSTSGGCPNYLMLRAVEKNTGVVIEARNVKSTNQSLATIPVGEWLITCHFYQAETYRNIQYYMSIEQDSPSFDVDFHDDLSIRTGAVAQSAMPAMASYDQIYCPFSKTILSGQWTLANDY